MPPIANKPRAKATARTIAVNLRMPQRTRDLIDMAADVSGKSRTEFMLESARLHATDVLTDQRLFVLDDEAHAAFLAVLDSPPRPAAKLRKLLAQPLRPEK
jgi:uncharacterized protein (DUF1778 family)